METWEWIMAALAIITQPVAWYMLIKEAKNR
jgi:hypothetical protein